LRNLCEHRVPGSVATLVIDRFETVEVEEDQR